MGASLSCSELMVKCAAQGELSSGEGWTVGEFSIAEVELVNALEVGFSAPGMEEDGPVLDSVSGDPGADASGEPTPDLEEGASPADDSELADLQGLLFCLLLRFRLTVCWVCGFLRVGASSVLYLP